MQQPNRRRFLYLAMGSGLAGLGVTRWRRQAACPNQAVSRAARAFGSQASLTVFHPSPKAADAALDSALGELETVERVMSLYRPDSQLCQLNQQGAVERPHPYLVEVLRKSEEVSRQTAGAFDVTIQPLWELYAQQAKAGRLPEQAAIEAARQRGDWRRVEIRPDRIRLHGEGTRITLNGIAQGYAADRVLATLRTHGIEHALVNTGEMNCMGGKPGGEAWTVGIQHPRDPEAYVELAALRDRALATSGDYATAFSDDFRAHHVFDPRTGRSPEELASVSIVAPSACDADALATAVLVLGAQRGLALVQATPQTDGLLVFKSGQTLATAGFPVGAATEG